MPDWDKQDCEQEYTPFDDPSEFEEGENGECS